jgi:hypothetical protein
MINPKVMARMTINAVAPFTAMRVSRTAGPRGREHVAKEEGQRSIPWCTNTEFIAVLSPRGIGQIYAPLR